MSNINASQTVIVYADGGSRGNPGPSGCGSVLKNGETQELICGLSKYLGIATNNVAEYSGLVLGLTEAKARGYKSVEVRMDSELVVKQMLGVYRVKNENLKPLFMEEQKLSRNFETFKIVHVRREYNKEADKLANEAMDKKDATLIQ